MTGYASVSGQGGEATGASAVSRRRGQDGASDGAGTEQDVDRARLNDGVDQRTCDGEGGARARHEEVRTWCRATTECQGGRDAGDGAFSRDWRRGVIAELITIAMEIDFCLPDLLHLLWGLS